jgi:hypothetical protein
LIGVPCRAKIGTEWIPGFVRDVIFVEVSTTSSSTSPNHVADEGENNDNNINNENANSNNGDVAVVEKNDGNKNAQEIIIVPDSTRLLVS